MVWTGLSAAIGSWKMLRDLLAADLPNPGTRESSFADRRRVHRAGSTDFAATISPGRGTIRKIDCAVTVLPQPDSPTLRACAAPQRVAHAIDGAHGALVERNWTRRSRTSSKQIRRRRIGG